MGKTLNKVQLIGHIGNEPECKTGAKGGRYAKFSLATNYRDKTEWHRCTAFGKAAEIVEQYVSKGDRLYVEGSIEYSQTEDESGKPRYWTDIVVREVLLLSGKQEAHAPASNPFDDSDDPFA